MLSSPEGKLTLTGQDTWWCLQKYWTISVFIVAGLILHLQVPRLGFAETSIEMIAKATKMKKIVLVVILLENEKTFKICQFSYNFVR